MDDGFKGKNVLIVGGCGGMGFEFARLLKAKQATVTVFDVNKPEDKKLTVLEEKGIPVAIYNLNYDSNTLKESSIYLSMYDIIMLAVPIEAFDEVVPIIAPFMKENSLLIDIASVKKQPLDIMLKHAPETISVLGSHPLFGPGIVSHMKGWNVVLVRPEGRCTDSWYITTKNFFESEGAFITELKDSEIHDRMVGITQVLTHFLYLSMAETLNSLKIKLTDAHDYATPPFEILMAFTGRLLNHNPLKLPATIQSQHIGPDIRRAYLQSALRLANFFNSRGTEEITERIAELSTYLGENYRSWAQSVSNRIIKPIGEFKGDLGISKGKIRVFKRRNGDGNGVVYGIVLEVDKDSTLVYRITENEFLNGKMQDKNISVSWDNNYIESDQRIIDESQVRQLLAIYDSMEKEKKKRFARLTFRNYELLKIKTFIEDLQKKSIGSVIIQGIFPSDRTGEDALKLFKLLKNVSDVTIIDRYPVQEGLRITFQIEITGLPKDLLHVFINDITDISSFAHLQISALKRKP